MTRLSLGEEHVCARCGNAIPRAEIGVIEEGHWLCSGCWNLWRILKNQAVSELLVTFLESGKPKDDDLVQARGPEIAPDPHEWDE